MTVEENGNAEPKKLELPYRPRHRSGKLRFAICCSSNMNRSMEAHVQLDIRGFDVMSFGSGMAVKLPGPSIDKPNIYEFDGPTYTEIREDLTRKNRDLYVRNGLLTMLTRNEKIKERPQKFQRYEEEFDVIICLEERVYDQVNDFLHKRPTKSGNLVHLINMDIRDTHEEAMRGALVVCRLCELLEKSTDIDNDIDDVLVDLNAELLERNFLHAIHFY